MMMISIVILVDIYWLVLDGIDRNLTENAFYIGYKIVKQNLGDVNDFDYLIVDCLY